VVLDPRDVAETPLQMHIWEDDDFADEEEDEENESEEQEEAQSPAKRPAARLGGNCVVTADGNEILKGSPLQAREKAVKELNRGAG